MSTEWLSDGGDPGRTRRVRGGVDLIAPRIRHDIPTAARESLVVVSPHVGAASATHGGEHVALPVERQIAFGLRAPLLDVAGEGALVDPPSAPAARWGKFLADVPGLQRLSWTTGWGPAGSLQMHSFERGVDDPRLVWEAPHDGAVYSPLTAVGDIDADGADEVVVSTWHGVLVYDIATGAEKYAAKYRETHGRHYGSLTLHTDASGGAYVLVVGDFAGHIASLAVRDGALSVLWYEKFDPQSEQGIDRRFTANRIGPDPVGDFDGDGRPEALMNVYNEADDGKWHLLAVDMETGRRKLDLPDEFLRGHHDLDGDGAPELLTQASEGRAVPTTGRIAVRRWDAVVWSIASARWSSRTIVDMPVTRDTGATRGRETTVAVGRGVVYTVAAEEDTAHCLTLGPNDEPRDLWSVAAPAGIALDAVGAADDNVMLRPRGPLDQVGDLAARGRQLAVVQSTTVSNGASPPVVIAGDSGGVVIVADTLDTISGWSVGEASAERLWTRPGRAMTTQAPQMLGIVGGDIDGDGNSEALAIRPALSGEAELVAYRADGSEAWTHVVDGYGAAPPVWNEGGVTRWAVGHFLDPTRLDALVAVRRSIMHSDGTWLIRSDTHETVWRRDILEIRPPWSDSQWRHTRGYGGGPMAFADFGGDGLDDIAMCYPAEYSVVDGATGEQMHVLDAGPLDGTDGYWAPSGEPLAFAVPGESVVGVLWRSPGILIAIAHAELPRVLWRTDPDDGANGGAALADVDGTGDMAIGAAGFSDGFRCYAAATGDLLWRRDGASSPVSNALAVDLDGDGRDEFVWAEGATIVAARDGEDVWQAEAPATVRYLAPIRVHGYDGLLATCDDGATYVLW
jgi:hypothetical protein